MSTPTKLKPNPEVKDVTRLVVGEYRKKRGKENRQLSFARFARELNQYVSQLGLSVSHQTIKNWEDGIYRPDYFFTLQLANHAPEGSWQRAFAMDILAVQWPELYQPGSEIGERLIKSQGNKGL